MLLEATQHTDNCFLTLTYADDHLPRISSQGLPTLSPIDLQLWLKRYRKAIAPLKVRFFAVGEYGEENHRPHYHLILFGNPTCVRGQSSFSKRTNTCCAVCDVVAETWGKGSVMLGTFTSESAQYVAGYVIKKMTAPDDFRLKGRHPEFTRMSRRGGIGFGMIPDIASSMMQFDLDSTEADVPVSLRVGSKMFPLGSSMRRKLREAIGREPNTPLEVRRAQEDELQPLCALAFEASTPLSKAYTELIKGSTDRVESRFKIQRKRKTL